MTHSAPKGASKEVIDLKGRKALVVGVANENSLAWSAAEHFRNAGADLAMTYLNDKAKPHVATLALELGADCPVTSPSRVSSRPCLMPSRHSGGESMSFFTPAWARKEDLHGRPTNRSADGFSESMLISCHSFIRMTRLAEPLMEKGGSFSPRATTGPRRWSTITTSWARSKRRSRPPFATSPTSWAFWYGEIKVGAIWISRTDLDLHRGR